MTVAQLDHQMGAGELVEWMAMERIEPFGGPADDYRGGLAAAVALNSNRKPGAQPVTPYQLMPWHELPPRVESKKVEAARVRAILTSAEKGAAKAAKKRLGNG